MCLTTQSYKNGMFKKKERERETDTLLHKPLCVSERQSSTTLNKEQPGWHDACVYVYTQKREREGKSLPAACRDVKTVSQ